VSKSVSKKVCLLGDFAVGKTSLVRRFVYDLFEDKYISTIGVKVSRKVVAVPLEAEVVEVNLMLWDLAGSEEFDRVRASYLRGSSGAVLVFDLTRADTLDSLQRYVQELQAVSPSACLVVAANKRDLVGAPAANNQTAIGEQHLADEADHLGAPCRLTSAKTGDEVEELFRELARMMIA
jgi:small GTP-binding protein